LNRFLYKDNEQNLETKDSSYNAGNVVEAEVPAIASGGAAQDINMGNVTINGQQLTPGTYPVTVLDVANWGWGQTCVFSSTDLDTVIWGAGVFKSADGTSYNILAGTTGNMAAKTYVYLDLLTSTTAYQITTTPGTAVGVGKVLVAVAQNAAVASPQPNATFNLNEANQIVGDNILANTINATKMSVGQLSAITADLGTITAGLITGATIQTATTGYRLIMSGTNNSYEFRSGSVLLAEMKAQITPDSGLAGAVFQHGTGECGISVYGQGVGLGDRVVAVFTNGGTSYFNFVDNDGTAGMIETNMRINSSWDPYSTGIYHLGTNTYKWDYAYIVDIYSTSVTVTDTFYGGDFSGDVFYGTDAYIDDVYGAIHPNQGIDALIEDPYGTSFVFSEGILVLEF